VRPVEQPREVGLCGVNVDDLHKPLLARP
jgi:hypothetical protein